MEFEIRKIEAINEEGKGWRLNTISPIGKFRTNATDQKRAFLYALHKTGYICKRGRMAVVFDGKTYTVQDRRTGQPLFAAVPC